MLGFGLILIGRKSTGFLARSEQWDKLSAVEDQKVFKALQIAGAALVGYGISTFFGARLEFFPINIINAEGFRDVTGVPMPVLRTILTVILTAAILVFIQRFVGIERQQLETQIDLRTVELKNLSEDLRLALREAEAATSAKSDFLAGMSHELRTPLNAILGFTQMMQFDPKNRPHTAHGGYLDNIVDAGNHLLNLINEILDLAEIEAGHLDLFVEEVSANEIVSNCVILMEPLGKQRDIEIKDNLSGGPAHRFLTDKTRLRQVLVNLLSNAVKYNSKGGTVTVDGQETEDGFLRITVSDTGIGIADKDRHRVFESFNRLEADSDIAQEGTGIGLSLSRLLVQRMAGRIGFESDEGVGTRFWVEFPLVSNEAFPIWTDTMKIGIDEIDDDHGHLISLLNQVSNDELDVDEIIDQMSEYIRDHFRREELVMEICNFPGLKEHCQLHRDFETTVNDLSAQWRTTRNPELLQDFRILIRDWLFNHIINTDAKIAPYAKKKPREIRKALAT